MRLSPEIDQTLLKDPDSHLYMGNIGQFAQASLYEPDAVLRSRVAFVYSVVQEQHWTHKEVQALTAESLQKFSDLPMRSLDAITAQPGQHLFLICQEDPNLTWQGHGWQWLTPAVHSLHATARKLGSGFGCDIDAVQFRP